MTKYILISKIGDIEICNSFENWESKAKNEKYFNKGIIIDTENGIYSFACKEDLNIEIKTGLRPANELHKTGEKKKRWVYSDSEKKICAVYNVAPNQATMPKCHVRKFQSESEAKKYINKKLKNYSVLNYFEFCDVLQSKNKIITKSVSETETRRVYYSLSNKLFAISENKLAEVPKGILTRKCKNSDEAKQFINSFPGAFKEISLDELTNHATTVVTEKYKFDTHPKLVSREVRESALEKDDVVAYIDGSYFDSRKACGSGVVFITKYFTERYTSSTKKADNLASRNVSGEILAAIIAIDKAKEVNAANLTIYHDYEGIQKWADGEWKTNKAITEAYFTYVTEARRKMNITFEKVKAHTGDWGNCDADALAKSATKV